MIMKDMIALCNIAREYEWDRWSEEIPYINWPSEWEVKAIPPFITGIIRYNVRLKGKPDTRVSIYLDCYDQAGYVGKPYWEIYPHEGDCFRCLMNETDELLEAIGQSLEEQDD